MNDVRVPDGLDLVEEALFPGVELKDLHALQQLVHLLHAHVLLFHHHHLQSRPIDLKKILQGTAKRVLLFKGPGH
jgi:hypothetical protein